MIRDPLLESGVAPESEHGGSTKLKYDKVSRWVFLLKIFLANFLLFFFCRDLGGTPSANPAPRLGGPCLEIISTRVILTSTANIMYVQNQT